MLPVRFAGERNGEEAARGLPVTEGYPGEERLDVQRRLIEQHTIRAAESAAPSEPVGP